MANNKKKVATKKKNTNVKKVSSNNKVKSTTTKTKEVVTNNKTIKKENTVKNNKKTSNSSKGVKKVTKEEVKVVDTNVSEKVETKKEKISFKKKITDFFNKFKVKSSKKKEAKKDKTAKKEKITFSKKIALIFSKKNKGVSKNTKLVKKAKNKKSSDKDFVLTNKHKKIFIGLAILCVSVLLIEGALFIAHKIKIDRNTVYYDSMNSLVVDGTDIVAVGSSNFRYSKNYDYTNGLEKAKLIKYDKNGKVLFEKMYETGISTVFSSIISVSDGYIVVGSGVFSEKEQLEEAREAFIIKYDKDGNMIWEKFYHDITNTKFNKVIETNDGYVAVGQSIYAVMEMGNHTTGGGIIIKYDKDGNLVWRNNHGGMKSGNFNDVVEVNGNFYVVGKDAVDSGNIVMYDKDGKYKWHKNYNYTDGIGFTGIAYLNNSLYVVGSKKILPEDFNENDSRNTTNTDALIVAYSLDGKVKFEKTYGGSNYERYNTIISHRDELYVVGHTSSKDAGFKIETDGELITGLIIRYDGKGNILKKEVFGGSHNDNLTDIYSDGVYFYVSGYSNSGDGNITTAKSNGKDYFGKVIKLDYRFRTILVK